MGMVNRREFIRHSALTAGVLTGISGVVFGQGSDPIAETTYGKIRGRKIDSVNAFQGIPYGAPTSGANRFMPAQKPQNWSGILDTVNFGVEAPQGPHLEIP